MATIVQPYNPWKEQLALTALGKVAGDIIGDIWKSHRQNEQNRKANAFRGQLQENLAQQGNISLTPQEAPQGYNSNPWAYALHQNYSPLTQFDIGTAGVTPKAPTIQDIAQGADSLAATPRFSMLRPELVQGVKNSMMQQAENQRLRDLQDSYANMFGNAQDIEGMMNVMSRGAIHGVVPPQVLTAFSPWAKEVYSPYAFMESDLGQNKVISATNRHTGMSTPATILPVTVSPNIREQGETQRTVATIGANANMYGDNIRGENERRRIEEQERQGQYERENPPRTTFTDAEGKVWTYNPRTGKFDPALDDEGYFIAGDTGRNPALTAAIRAIDNEMKILDDQAKEIKRNYRLQDNPDENAMNKELEPIIAKQGELSRLREQYVDQMFPKERQRRKPVQPTSQPPAQPPAQPTVREVAENGDKAPEPARTDYTPMIMAVGNASSGVRPRPQTPSNSAQGNTPTENLSDFSPSFLGDRSTWQGITAPATPKITALSTDQHPAQPPAKQRQPRAAQGNMREFTVSDDMAYNPVRDKDIVQSKIYTPEHFRNFIQKLQQDQRFAHMSTEELIDWAYRIGIRIKQ